MTGPAAEALAQAGDKDPEIQARVGVRHLLKGDPGTGRDALEGSGHYPLAHLDLGRLRHGVNYQG